MPATTELTIAAETWIALCLLHLENPSRSSFTAREIVDRASKERLVAEARKGLLPHIYQHNVANLPPSPSQHRLFIREDDGRFRLTRPDDHMHPERHGRMIPDSEDLPREYRYLLDYYHDAYCKGTASLEETDPVLRMRGVGKEIWADEDGDTFIARERASWDDPPTATAENEVQPAAERVWDRILRHQGESFDTATGLKFTYAVEGNGIWFYRDGKRIEKRLGRGDVEKAVARCPLSSTTEIRDCFDSSYLFGLLTDERIRARDW